MKKFRCISMPARADLRAIAGFILASCILFSNPLFVCAETRRGHSVPRYILNGLQTYATEGYEAAVHRWFAGSPWANAAAVVAKIAYLKNIEMLYGRYKGYDIVTTRETRTSQMTYVRFNYVRLSGYAMFFSSMSNNQWVLFKLELHRMQKFADTR